MSLTATIIADILASYTKAADCGTATFPPILSNHFVFCNGTGARQANAIWCDGRALEAGATDVLDLSGGLIDIYGKTLEFTAIKALALKAHSTNAGDLFIGSGLTSPPTGFSIWLGADGDSVRVGPGGLLLLVLPDADGYEVTAETGDRLTVANPAATAANYDIFLAGAVA
jgi:hypothetical protein